MKRSWLLLALACIAFAQSQPPSPAPSKATQNDKGKAAGKDEIAATDKAKSDSLQTEIDQLKSKIASWENSQSSKQGQQNTSPDGWLKWSTIISAVAALAIAILAGIQAWVIHKQRMAMDAQVGYMKDGLTQTKNAIRIAVASANIASDNATTAEKTLEAIKSQVRFAQESVEATRRAAEATVIGAEAAKVSADAANKNIDFMISKERARLKIYLHPVMLDEQLPATLGWSVTNYGDSKAFVTHARSRVFLAAPEEAKPDVSNFTTPNQDLYGLPIKPEDSRSTQAIIAPVLGDTHKDIQGGAVTLWFYALVEYQDAFGKYHSRTLRRLQPLPPWANSGIPMWEEGSEET